MQQPNPARLALRFAACALLLFLVPLRALAASPVVEADWLAEHRQDPDLVVLHVGDEAEYAAEHVPGALFLDTAEIRASEEESGGLQLQLPSPDALARTLGGYGIGDDSRVVVVFGGNWVTPSTRTLFTLQWIGLEDRAFWLNGGLEAWKAAGHAVTDEIAGPKKATLTPNPRADLVVDAAWVREHRGDAGICLVDARAPVHYQGIEATHLHREPVRKGHIPGAGNLPFTLVVDDALKIRPEAELRALFDAAGYAEGDTVVGYCHLGLFATLMILGARTLDMPVKLYDGSFQDWGHRDDLPVEMPGEGR